MQDETGWLVERINAKETDGPRYLMGVRQGYGSMWTTDHEHAIRFSRMVDAARLIETLGESARAVEHMWCEPRRDIMDGRGRRDIMDGRGRRDIMDGRGRRDITRNPNA